MLIKIVNLKLQIKNRLYKITYLNRLFEIAYQNRQFEITYLNRLFKIAYHPFRNMKLFVLKTISNLNDLLNAVKKRLKKKTSFRYPLLSTKIT